MRNALVHRSAGQNNRYNNLKTVLHTDAPPAWPVLLVVLAVTAAVMGSVCANRFVLWDDQITVACNAQMAPLTWTSLRFWWSGPTLRLYTPLTYTVWGLISLVAQAPTDPVTGVSQNPVFFHAANFVVHLLSTAMVFRILMQVSGRRWAAGAGALVFGIHPLQVETVAWVTAFNGALSSCLGLAAVLQMMRFSRERAAGKPGGTPLVTSWVLGSLAMLAKPSAVVFPFIAAILGQVVARSRPKQTVNAIVPWLFIAGALSYVAMRVQPVEVRPPLYPASDRLLVAIDTFDFYLAKVLVPTQLRSVYRRSPLQVMRMNAIFFEWLMPVAIGVLLAKYRLRFLYTGVLIFIVAVLPVSGLIRFDFQHFSTPADRYAYAPMLGVAVCITQALDTPTAGWFYHRRRWWMIALMIAVAVSMALLSHQQIRVWHDTESLRQNAFGGGADIPRVDWPGKPVYPGR